MSFIGHSLRYLIAILTLIAGILLFFFGGIWYFLAVFYRTSWIVGLVSFLLGLGLIFLSYMIKPHKFN
jgi:hypothetical protein